MVCCLARLALSGDNQLCIHDMAQYAHLPIYNLAYELLKEFYQRVPKFAKQYKYLLGEKLIGANVEVI